MSSRKTPQTFSIPRPILLLVAAFAVTAFVPFQVATITVDPATTYQTMAGWEASANATQIDGPMYAVHASWPTDSPVLMDLLVNDLGITRLRLSLRSGAENPTDYYQLFKDGQIDRPNGFNPHRYDVVNDNNDPFVTGATKFHWTDLDENIEMLVLPFRARALASGQTPYIDLCYIDFDNVSAFKHSDSPDEYAEFVLAAFQHIQSAYGFAPDGFEVILEGDIAERWQDPIKIGRSLVAAQSRLSAAGFHPQFIAPSSTSLAWAVNNFDALLSVPGVAAALNLVTYHLYWDNADANLIALSAKATARGMKTGMTELIGADHVTLSNDLRKANVSVWQQFAMASYGLPDGGGKYYINTGTGYYPGDRTRYLRQYFRYIRPGAVRIGAATSNGELTPVAFINPGGRYTVVANSTSAQAFTVGNLPAGTYGIRYTTATTTDVNPGNQTIVAGGVISTSIPGAGAITVFNVPAQGPPPGAFGKTGPSNGSTGLATSLTLTWNASSGATGYEYCLDTTNNGACDTSWISAGSSLGAGLSGLLSNTTYYWQVRANSASGTTYADGGAGVFWNFKAQAGAPAPPGPFYKTAPDDRSAGLPTSLNLGWTASAGATGYEYCLDTTNNGLCDAAWTSAGALPVAGLSGLAGSTTYYWQVRAINANGTPTYADAGSSAFVSFTTQAVAPGAFSKSSPATGAPAVSNSLTLTWNASTGATAYEYCIDTVNNGACDTSWIANGPALNVALSALLGNTTYYWQVRATNAIGTIYADGSPSAFWSFTTQVNSPAPGPFYKTSPDDGSTGLPTSVSLGWTPSAGATGYEYCFDTTDNGACDGAWTFAGALPNALLTGLAGNTTYYWQVRAVNADGTPTYADAGSSAFVSFTTLAVAPGQKAQLTTPAPGSTLDSDNVTFTWTGGLGVTQYWLQVGSTLGGADIANINTGTALSATVSTLPTDGELLFVRLQSLINGAWQFNDYTLTAARLFMIQKAELVTPAPHSTLTSSTVAFEWTGGSGATAYRLSVGTAAGTTDLFDSDAGSDLSIVVSGLPNDGRPLFVRLWSQLEGSWEFNDYEFTATTQVLRRAELTTPAPGSSLRSSTVTFEWNGGIGVTATRLSVGTTAGAADLFDRDVTTQVKAVVDNLPTDGRTLFVRLWSLVGGVWQWNDSTLTAATIVAPVLAELISPAAGSTLTESAVTFEWTGGTGVSAYWFSIGNEPGGSDIATVDATSRLSATVTGLPADGRALYVRLFSLIGETWRHNDYVLTAATIAKARAAELIRPAPESTLTAAGFSFEWTGGAGVSAYRLTIGTSEGASDLVDRDAQTSLSATVGGLPIDGRTMFVRLWSLIAGSWQFRDYTFRGLSVSASRPAELLSPAAGSKLESTTVQFRWRGGTGVSHMRLTIGTAPGSDDIASLNVETSLSAFVPGLPSDGRRIYVRLYSFIDGAWEYRDYVLTAVGGDR